MGSEDAYEFRLLLSPKSQAVMIKPYIDGPLEPYGAEASAP